jgi:hypothetical protein
MIAGAGFAMMAWKLAQHRYGVRVGFLPYDRDLTWRTHDRLSMEYHCINDQARRGLTALKVAHRLNMHGDDPRIVL